MGSTVEKHLSSRTSIATGAAATGAQVTGSAATGALALGALAVGAAAIGALAIGRLTVGRARFGRVEIDDLLVRRIEIGNGQDLIAAAKQGTAESAPPRRLASPLLTIALASLGYIAGRHSRSA